MVNQSTSVTNPQVDSNDQSDSHHCAKGLQIRLVHTPAISRVDQCSVRDEEQGEGAEDALQDAPGEDTKIEEGILDSRQVELRIADTINVVDVLKEQDSKRKFTRFKTSGLRSVCRTVRKKESATCLHQSRNDR